MFMLPVTFHRWRGPTDAVRPAVIVAIILNRRMNGRRSDAFGWRVNAGVIVSTLSLLLLI